MYTFAIALFAFAYSGSAHGSVDILMDGGSSYFSVPLAHESTVGDILQTLDIEPYHFNGNLARRISDGDTINLPHLRFQNVRTETPIPYETMVVINPTIFDEEQVVTVEGELGLEVLYSITIFYNDQEISTIERKKEVVKYPLMAVVELGDESSSYVDIPEGRFRIVKHFVAEATAYSPEQAELSNYTFTGIRFTTGIAAVDPNVVPLGSYIYVPEYGLFLAADIGSAIQGYTVDLSFDTIQEALLFGRKDVDVFVLDKKTDLF